MKEKLIRKLFITLLVSCVFSAFIINNGVKAASTEEINDEISENLIVEDKIMKYDARTNEITEVSMEELQQINSMLKSTNGGNSYSLEAYNPDEYVYTETTTIRDGLGITAASETLYREKITDTTAFPYRVICKVFGYDSKNVPHGGSGVLVGKNLLLTAAHCVFDKDNNNAAYISWKAFPGYNNGILNNLASGWATVYYSSAWFNGHSSDYDWALCVLENDIGTNTGYLGAQVYGTSEEMVNLEVYTSRISCKWR